MKPRVVVAMSGGVDSSVAAAMLAGQGVEAIGVTARLLSRGATGYGCCGSPQDVADARRVCETLGMPHYTVDLADLFESRVIQGFVGEYLDGRTPNPCVECNRHVKFGRLLELARAWGAESLATGHYARVENGRLRRAADEAKDQSYFLYRLGPEELGRVLFPVGGMRKEEVRSMARGWGLRVADKPDSQEACFVPRRDVRGFLADRAGATAALSPGAVTDREGRVVGTHRGAAGYTIGQRKGMRLAGPERLYVVEKDTEANTLIVGTSRELLCRRILVEAVTWTTAKPPPLPRRAQVRLRHRHPPAPANILVGRGGLEVEFDEPQRAPAPGQAAVFYDASEVLGGGSISRRLEEAP